jgi:hypothetical protein
MKPAVVVAIALSIATGCTTLGPMPIATGISSVPANRTSVEVSAGAVSGFMLSDGAHADNAGRGTPLQQVSGLLEPGDLVGIKGLVVGARKAGNGGGDDIVEPFVGVRRTVAEDVSVSVIGYGTEAHGSDGGNANYDAKRLGAEVGIDDKLLGTDAVSIHAQASVSATGIWANGHYCVDTTGDGIDCNNDGHDTVVNATVDGFYGAATAGLSLDLFRNPHGWFHVARLATMVSVGAMPRLNDGVQQTGDKFITGGATLTLGFGAR